MVTETKGDNLSGRVEGHEIRKTPLMNPLQEMLKELFEPDTRVASTKVTTFQEGKYETKVTTYHNKDGKTVRIGAESYVFKDEKTKQKESLEKELDKAVAEWRFEDAAKLRDQIQAL